MYFSYCDNCKTKECEYGSARALMNDFEKNGYKFAGCPDKEDAKKVQELLLQMNPNRRSYIQNDGSHCTADIRIMDDNNDEVYFEFKRIPFAFETEEEIGVSKAFERIMFLICEAFDIYDEYADIIRNNYTICIRKGYIPEFDRSTFYAQYQNKDRELKSEIVEFVEDFIDYIYENINKWSTFCFKRKASIEIEFIKDTPFKDTKENVAQSVNSNLSHGTLDNISLSNIIMQQEGFFFEIPSNKGGGIKLNKYIDLICNPDTLLSKLFQNFEKARNSFYGIESQRYVIHDVFFKYNNDTLYEDNSSVLTSIGEYLLSNIRQTLDLHMEELRIYKQYYDRSYLFVTLGKRIWKFEIF